jgi:P4 family phage/plasmid primase-like protien
MTRDEINDLLRGRLGDLAHYLYPNGKRNGRYWKIGNATGNPGKSLDINLETGWFGDHATDQRMSTNLINLWMTARRVDFPSAMREAHAWLGIPFNGQHEEPSFNWALCVSSVSEEQIKRLSDWRGYTIETCKRLKAQKISGIYGGCWAFPVHDKSGQIIGCHYRTKNGGWAYTKGTKSYPLILGDPTQAKIVHIHEGEWDGLAQLDKEQNYFFSEIAMIITRGATNAGKLEDFASLISTDAIIYVWPQNDEPDKNGVIPSEEWFKAVCKALCRELYRVEIPREHKDLNDWNRAGASWEDLQEAIDVAEPIPAHVRESAEGYKSPSPENGDSQKQTAKSIELELVERLTKILPPITTLGQRWFVFQDGIWTVRERHHYLPEALAIINPKYRTNRLANDVLSHIQGKCQAKESPFCGAYKYDGEDILVSVANGILRIGTDLTLEPASRKYHFTQRLAVSFDPEAVCPVFSQALVQNLPEPKDQNLFKTFCASVFVPDCRWEAALCCFGETGTGKSTLFEGIEAMVGKGPCQSLSLMQLCDPESYNAPDLEYAMLNFSTELNALELASDRFKQLVSGERIPVRAIYNSPYYIKPTCKYAFLTNHLPRFKDGTGAELRRLRFLKFTHVPAQKDLALKKHVATEGSGILNLLVRLVAELLKLDEMPHGDKDSEVARRRFQIANDPVGIFVQTECVLDRQAYEACPGLEARFKTFLEHHGLREGIASILFKQLYDRFNVAQVRPRLQGGGRERGVTGIELKPITESNL